MSRAARTARFTVALMLSIAPPAVSQPLQGASDAPVAVTTPSAPPGFLALRRAIRTAAEPDALDAAIAGMADLAGAGDLQAAQFLAGEYRSPGGAIPADPGKALTYLRIASELGDTAARTTLVETLKASDDPEDRQAALSLLQQSFDAGDISVGRQLASAYRTGALGNAVDVNRAVAIYRILAQSGDTSARTTLIGLLRTSDDPAQKRAALDHMQMAFDAGDMSVAGSLANAYRTGSLANQADMGKAIAIYRVLADSGDLASAKRLIALYRAGTGAANDEAMALSYLTVLAAAGDAEALEQLGIAYHTGRGAPVDLAKAEAAYRRAADLGNSRATLALAAALASQSLGIGREPEAVVLLEDAVKRETPGAAILLANALFAGKGVPASPQRAVDILKSAARRGDASAILVLLDVYIRGRGPSVPANLAAAATLYRAVPEAELTPAIRALGVVISGAAATTAPAWADLAKRLEALDENGKMTAGTQLLSLNPNAYVYLLQSKLFAGSTATPNGILTSPTIAAMNSFCEGAGIESACRFGPLDRRVWAAIGPLLFAD